MFTVYSKPNCGYCDQAKALLRAKGEVFTEIHIDVGQPKTDDKQYITVQELKAKIPTAASAPQILRDDVLVGGFTELKKLLE